MSGNGREPKRKEPKKLTPIEQMKILHEHTLTALKMMDVLYGREDLDELEVTWRLASIVGMLAIAQSEIETMIIIMEDN